MDPAMGNWSENQVFKIPVSHLPLPLWTFIPSSFPSTEQDALLAKKKVFKLPLLFVWEDTLRLGEFLVLELGFHEIGVIAVLGAGIPQELGHSCCGRWGKVAAVALGAHMDSRWDVGLTHRYSSTWGIPSTAPGVPRKELGWLRRELWLVASDWDNGNLCMRHQKLNPKPQHFTSPSKCSSGSVPGSRSAWDITSECFSRGWL